MTQPHSDWIDPLAARGPSAATDSAAAELAVMCSARPRARAGWTAAGPEDCAPASEDLQTKGER